LRADYFSRYALKAGEGARAPSNYPHHYSERFWAKPSGSDAEVYVRGSVLGLENGGEGT